MINISLLKFCQPMSFYTYKYYTDIKIGVTFFACLFPFYPQFSFYKKNMLKSTYPIELL